MKLNKRVPVRVESKGRGGREKGSMKINMDYYSNNTDLCWYSVFRLQVGLSKKREENSRSFLNHQLNSGGIYYLLLIWMRVHNSWFLLLGFVCFLFIYIFKTRSLICLERRGCFNFFYFSGIFSGNGNSFSNRHECVYWMLMIFTSLFLFLFIYLFIYCYYLFYFIFCPLAHSMYIYFLFEILKLRVLIKKLNVYCFQWTPMWACVTCH